MSNTATRKLAGGAMQMMPSSSSSSSPAAGDGTPLVLAGSGGGLALIPQPTGLARLNYYDGKFLRADDLRMEQDYLRTLVWTSNRAGGSGVVSGLDLRDAGGGTLEVTAGLAIDPQGRVLYLPHGTSISVQELIAKSRAGSSSSPSGSSANGSSSNGSSASGASTPGFAACDAAAAPGTTTTAVGATDLYLVVAQWAEALCGEADVYGKLCEDACITATDRPYRLEGIVLRAIPLSLGAPACTASGLTAVHRRSQVASAYFADERARLGADVSGARLKLDLWCSGATSETGDSVPLGVISVSSSSVQWADEWIARRERMAGPPLRFWQWQTGMRPLAVFWAQVLQFQCQLADLLQGNPAPGGVADPCASQFALLKEAQRMLAVVEGQYRDTTANAVAGAGEVPADPAGAAAEIIRQVADLGARMKATVTQVEGNAATRVLITGGITELPPAGWLPVSAGPIDVNTQVRRMLGEGVDLRFCSVRADYTSHAFEEAQHLERICLLSGLADPNARPRVDILVPDGTMTEADAPAQGVSAEVRLSIDFIDTNTETGEVTGGPVLQMLGAARGELAGAGATLYFAGSGAMRDPTQVTVGGVIAVPTNRAPETPETTAAAPAADTAKLAGTLLRRAFGPRAAADEARGGVEARQTAASGGTQTGGAGTPARGGNGAPAVVPAVWATLQVEGDPFALQVNGSVGLRGNVAVCFDDDGGPIAGELQLIGELRAEDGGNGEPRLTGRARGVTVWRQEGETPDTEPQDLPVALSLLPTAEGGAALQLRFQGPDAEDIALSMTWSARPVVGRGVASLLWQNTLRERLNDQAGGDANLAATLARRYDAVAPRAPAEVPFARVEFIETPEVAKPANAYHAAAAAGLAELEARLRQGGLADAALAKLFPAPARAPDGGTITATRDWVLFTRRRESSCDCTCTPAPVVAALRYRVYHLRVPFDTTPDEVRRELSVAMSIPGLQTLAAVPEFVAGSATLSTPGADVVAAWHAANPGTAIVYGAVAGAAGGDPAAVQSARLQAIATLVHAVTPDTGAAYDALASIPPGLAAGGVDGVMLLVTASAPLTICHEVYAYLNDNRDTGLVRDFEATKSRTELLALLNDKLATGASNFVRLGTASFVDGTPTFAGALTEVEAGWEKLNLPGMAGAVVIAPDADASGGVRVAQAMAIASDLGGSVTPLPAVTSYVPSASCAAVTILLRSFQLT